MAPILPTTQLPPVEVFAVEDRAAQLTWRRLPDGHLVARIGDAEHDLGPAARPGAAEIGGMEPGTEHAIDLSVDGRLAARTSIRTLDAMAGPSIKIATVNDLHFGEDGFGLVKQLRDRHTDPYPLRCARSAARDALDWGAELLVIKGDITCHSRAEEWEMFDEFLADIPIPVMAIPGNHDTIGHVRSLDPTIELQRRGLFPEPVTARQVGGTTIITVDTTLPTQSHGSVGHRQDDILAALDVDRPAVIFTHHHFEDRPVPWFWPLGLRYRDGTPLIESLLEANPDLFFSAGHTHRNRMRRHKSAVITEVSSTKDYPGVWAGYVLSPTGIRQVVRRISDPSSLHWTDRTHAAVAGIWGRWTPGPLTQRSFDHAWSRDYDAISGPSQAWSSPSA